MKNKMIFKGFIASAMIWTMTFLPMVAVGQTRISLPKNRYNVEQDVKLGRDYSVQIEQQFPIVNDGQINQYIQGVGARLVAGIPQQFRQPAFQYTFRVVNASDINAFALPGGPMYINRGMIQAAINEGEMAGVMAHEISHVALRHATAQATRQSRVGSQLGVIGLILGGAILGGQTGAQLGALGAQVWMTRYSREYENQADVLGAQIMANAGYDPRDLAAMFQTIAAQGSSRAPEFLSSHPDPGNRFQNINREAQLLRVSSNPIKITAGFERTKYKLASMPPAQTMAQIEQGRGQAGGGQSPTAGGRYSTNVQAPSNSRRNYTSGNWIQMSVPSNWREFPTQQSVIFAPEGAYGDQGITHGAMIGLARPSSTNLTQGTQEFVRGLLQGNAHLRQSGGYQNTRLSGRQALATTLSGTSPVTRRVEVVTIYTTQLRNGELFYVAAVAPQNETSRYNNAF
ncbi:MAG: M48 family metalloprotease, partial [Blastocatellia bacterium]|nr:M48 family metalloprotease [Blastocatellia bacterium]